LKILIAVSVLISFQIRADNEAIDLDAIFEMSFETLMKIKVKTTSKKEENIEDSPGVVTVITSGQIKELGAKNLDDILKTVPGVFSFENYFSLSQQYSFRGNLSEDYNTKVLFMINGHPSYHTQNGTFFTDMVPIEIIDRVEIIKGPVSVLYGTNALTGVINVITKPNLKDSRKKLNVQTGSFSTLEGKFNLSEQWAEANIVLSAAIKKQQGYKNTITDQQDWQTWTGYKGGGGETVNYEEYTQVFAQINYSNWALDINYFDQDKSSKYGIMPSLYFSVPNFDIDIFSADFRYQDSYSTQLKFRYVLRLDSFDYAYTVNNYQWLDGGPLDFERKGKGNWKGKKYGAEFITDFTFKNGDIIAGFLWDEYQGDPVIFETGTWQPFVLIPEPSNNRDIAVYANARYKVLKDKLEYVIGIRNTQNKISGSHFDYRLGVIWQYSQNTTIKTLWGTSYRSANFNELNVDAPPVIIGNNQLAVEVLAGLDLSLTTHGENYLASLNYFWNETDNEISVKLNSNDIPSYQNILGKESSGIEFDFTLFFNKQVKMYARGAYIFAVKDLQSGKDISHKSIKNNYAFGVSYQLNSNLNANLNISYTGNWLSAENYWLANFNIRYQLPQLDGFELYLLAHNVFDKNYDYAQWQNWPIETIPAQVPKSITFGFSYTW